MRLLVAALVILLPAVGFASQRASAATYAAESGYIEINHKHERWPSPEKLTADLRSSDDAIRLKALLLLGFTEDQAYYEVWSQTSPTKTLGKRVVTADQVQVTYASLGEDLTQDAILELYISQRSDTFVAIAKAAGGVWERIATSDCWCRYEINPLAEFVQLSQSPDFDGTKPPTYELVLRASGGGSGLYQQDEERFRVRDGELRKIMAFSRRSRNCNNGPPGYDCRLELRWFGPENVEGDIKYVLIEAYGIIPGNAPAAIWSFRELEDRDLKRFSCISFQWDAKRFRYERLKDKPDSCDSTLARKVD
jgi:hypothetical protein